MLTIKRMSVDDDVSNFVSYEKDLVEFLQEDAMNDQIKLISVTYLLYGDGELLGYVTILNDRFDLNPTLKDFFRSKKILYSSLPAVKIGRLCVDDKYRRMGYGRKMLSFVINLIKKKLLLYSGCRYVVLDSKKKSVNFYVKNNFTIYKQRKHSIVMYLDINSKSNGFNK